MKYGLLLLPLLTSAALAATSETRWDVRGLWSAEPAPPATPLAVDPPWLTSEASLLTFDSPSSHDPHARSYAGYDPHAAHDPHVAHDPHAAHELHAGHDPHAELYDGADPHPQTQSTTSRMAPVERSTAPHGRTVAETFAERAALNGKQVRLRATVVKLTEGILGKTYLHLQDGTGSLAERNHDLTATTTEAFELGETLELEGQLAIDQDVGLGYEYEALLTHATRVRAR